MIWRVIVPGLPWKPLDASVAIHTWCGWPLAQLVNRVAQRTAPAVVAGWRAYRHCAIDLTAAAVTAVAAGHGETVRECLGP